jgi:hypothetical protein
MHERAYKTENCIHRERGETSTFNGGEVTPREKFFYALD